MDRVERVESYDEIDLKALKSEKCRLEQQQLPQTCGANNVMITINIARVLTLKIHRLNIQRA